MSLDVIEALAGPPRTLVDQLLAEQAVTGTAVEHFDRWHRRHETQAVETPGGVTARFRHLIPLSNPGPGEQYAFEVTLARCTGCKACVVACHGLNGLDDGESWRDIGVVALPSTPNRPGPVLQTITTACHHCEDPACANGCPVLAYHKDEDTGIVRHLDDQCIGCSYCVLKCPYDVPKYNRRRGIVRKCDMCHQRLAVGEAPACVQSCPTEAIAIRLVPLDQPVAPGARLVPGAFASEYTRPTTRYIGHLPAAETSDDAATAGPPPLRLDPAHPPLSVMLVLTQMATGALIMATLFAASQPSDARVSLILRAAAVVGTAGLAASVLHLGQPLKAWRIFLGWRRSWLSREALVFGAFGTALWAVAGWPAVTATAPGWGLVALAAGLGLAGVAASAMVYIDTRRPFWSAGLVAMKFGGTTLALGAALAAAVWSWQDAWCARPAAATALISFLALACWEGGIVTRAARDASSPWHRSARVLRTMQPRLRWMRITLIGVASCAYAVAFLAPPSLAAALCSIALAAATASQLIERHQFFTACHGPRMPGLS
jgi:Fe-S-cluster-containing dehydrogenase component/DMSO reductase anchor subunit